jgi:KaiC/GvpD/RAD55 family RecA-like ATPase
MKSTTGIDKLDKILEGGFPQKGAILINGPSGVGKSTFCQQFISRGVAAKDSAVYIALDSDPEDIVKSMNGFGWNMNKYLDGVNAVFLDAYSWKVGGSEEKPWKKILQGGLDINSLNVMFSEILNRIKSDNKRSVFDSVSSLMLYIPSDIVIKFIPIMIAKARSYNSTQIIVIEEGVHGPEIANTLSYLSDGVIDMKMEGSKRLMRISKMKESAAPRDWMEFKIDKSGISLV